MQRLLLLPAYNEEAALRELLPKALAVVPELRIVVLDDGSTDGTSHACGTDRRVALLRHEDNRGLAAATRSLVQHALEVAEDDDVVIMMDADNSMSPDLIPTMLRRIAGGADVVIASRFSGGSERGVPFVRRLYSRGARILFTTFFRLGGVRDYTCAYRAYRVGALRRLHARTPSLFHADGFAAMVELLLNLSSLPGTRIEEVPLHLRYDQKAGDSKMDVPKTVREYLALVVRMKLGPRRARAGSRRVRVQQP